MSYELAFTTTAMEDISFLRKTDKLAFKKLEKLLLELTEHPKTGTGKRNLKNITFQDFIPEELAINTV